MFKAIKELDKFKNYQTHYYLTQGDSCVITSTPMRNGEIVKSGIEECKFKFADSSYEQIFSIVMTPDTSGNGTYVAKITTSYTHNRAPGQYFYEIEYKMTDGSIQTPNSWKFDILPQIREIEFGG